MVSRGNKNAAALARLREWVQSKVPEACGFAHDTETLTDYVIAELTSVAGSEEQIRASCEAQLELFILSENLTEFIDMLFVTVRALSGEKLLCLSDECSTAQSPVGEPTTAVLPHPASDSLPMPSGPVMETGLGDVRTANQLMFVARQQALALIDRQRQALAQRLKNIESEVCELRHKIARMERKRGVQTVGRSN